MKEASKPAKKSRNSFGDAGNFARAALGQSNTRTVSRATEASSPRSRRNSDSRRGLRNALSGHVANDSEPRKSDLPERKLNLNVPSTRPKPVKLKNALYAFTNYIQNVNVLLIL